MKLRYTETYKHLRSYTAWKVSKYQVFFCSVFSRIRPEVCLRIQCECGKIRNRKNSIFWQTRDIFLLFMTLKKMLFFVFWLCLKMIFTNLLCCNNLWGKFFVVSRKYKKLAIFDILMMTITLGVYMKIRQMTPFFLSTFRTLSVGTFYFCISRPSKFGSVDSSSLCIIFWSVKHTHSKYDTLKLASIDIFFLHKIC